MQFITTDQRIAVENFEIGLIYTVTFTSGSYFLGACIGIGKDYVMFQRTAPELIFSLTMAAAADVASIEPLPEEIGQILEYTGSVPVSIKTDGTPLLDYLITGNTTQDGTPTPDSPIMPEGCGELEAGQYKIQISSANTTTPIYLGEVQSTRRIKKYEFTGQETFNITISSTESGTFVYSVRYDTIGMENIIDYDSPMPYISYPVFICSHFKMKTNTSFDTPYTAIKNGEIGANSVANNTYNRYVVFASNQYTSVDTFNAFLAAQYAAGTPVTVWYVLATETTGIINEPLMRIGDYADTLSYRQSDVNIPTTDGLNIFDIDTTVKPSEVYLKYFSPLL